MFFLRLRRAASCTLFPYTTLFRSLRHGSDKTLQVGYANHFYRSAHKFEQICRHRLRASIRSVERFSRNAETDLVWRIFVEKKNQTATRNARDSTTGPSTSTSRNDA